MEASAIAKANVANGTGRISKAAVGLEECVSVFPHLGLEGFLPTIQHWVQATHAERMASRRRHRVHPLIYRRQQRRAAHDESGGGDGPRGTLQ
eukprot:scaffold25119_cov63-Phaeocystis_antarctica.AAC.1